MSEIRSIFCQNAWKKGFQGWSCAVILGMVVAVLLGENLSAAIYTVNTAANYSSLSPTPQTGDSIQLNAALTIDSANPLADIQTSGSASLLFSTGSLVVGNITQGSHMPLNTNANTVTLSGNIVQPSIVGDLITLAKQGTGTLILTGNNNGMAGRFRISEGNIQLGDGTTNPTFANLQYFHLQEGTNLVFNVQSSADNPYIHTTTTTYNTLNDYTVRTGAKIQIANGYVQWQAGATDVDIQVDAGKTLDWNVATEGTTETFGKSISGEGAFVKSGDGELVLTNKSSYTGGTTVKEGTLTLKPTSGTVLPGYTNSEGTRVQYPVTVEEGATLNVATNGAFGNNQECPSLLTLNGGTLRNSSAAHITVGNITMNNGTLISNTTSTTDYGNFILDARVVASGTNNLIQANSLTAGFRLSSGIDVGENASLTIDAVIQQTSTGTAPSKIITKTGVGDLIFTKANTYEPGTVIQAGRLILREEGTLGTGDVTIAYLGALQLENGETLANNMKLTGGGTTFVPDVQNPEDGRNSGVIYFRKSAELTGTLTSTDAVGIRVANGETGTISGNFSHQPTELAIQPFAKYGLGTLILSGENNSLTGDVRVYAGTLQTNAKSLSQANQIMVDADSMLNLNVAGNISETLNKVVTGAGTLVKSGAGEVILGAKGTYTGGTEVREGTLTLTHTANNMGTLPTLQPVTVYQDAVLKVSVNGAMGHASHFPSAITLYGGTLLNASTSHITTTATNLHGATLRGNGTASTSEYGDFLIDNTMTVDVLYDADGNVVERVSKIENGSISIRFVNNQNGKITVKEGATLEVNADIVQAPQSTALPVTKDGMGKILFGGNVNHAVQVTEGSVEMTPTSVFEQPLTIETGVEAMLGGTSNRLLSMDGLWLGQEGYTLKVNSGDLILGDDLKLALPTEDVYSGLSLDIFSLGDDASLKDASGELLDPEAFDWERLLSSDAMRQLWNLGFEDGTLTATVGSTAVPEPGTWCLLLLGMAWLLRRRYSRK
ncbi:MAG: autotransporter-associated beta strand repeat-containing protein [Planctomycetia bacterium]|nr:autotransporter-associated beta strand repeat-containing protein [Planctomycetia bacterium]